MFFSKTVVTLLPALAVMGTPIIGPLLNKGSISQRMPESSFICDRVLTLSCGALEQFDDLLFYYKYASSTYTDCPKPNGNTMVKQVLFILFHSVCLLTNISYLAPRFWHGHPRLCCSRRYEKRSDSSVAREVNIRIQLNISCSILNLVFFSYSSSATDFLVTDASVLLKPYTSPGVDVPGELPLDV